MASFHRQKLFAAAAVALLVTAQTVMGFLGHHDLYPLFTWNLYSMANTNTVILPTIEIKSIDGKPTSRDVLSAYQGTVAFSQRYKLARAVDAQNDDRARSTLKALLKGANVPYKSDVEFVVHLNRVLVTDYVRTGAVISQQSLVAKFERLQ